STFAGGGSSNAEGALATSAQLRLPWSVAVDRSGNVYIADSMSHRIRKVAAGGTITTIAGTGLAGFTGDGGQALSARLSTPRGVAVDAAGRVYVSDTGNNRVRVISTGGTIQTVAALDSPRGLALDSAGNLYVAEAFGHRVRRVSPSGAIATVAGTGAPGFSGDGGPAVDAQLDTPLGVAVDGSGNLYIADAENHRIRVVLAGLPAVAVAPQSLSFAAQSGGPRAVHRVLNVTGSVAGSPYTVTVEMEGGGEWLSAKPLRGTLPAAVEVNAEAIDLSRGVYRGVVRIAAPNATPPVLAVPVTFTVTPSPLGKYLVEPGELVFHFAQGTSASTRTLTLSSVGSAEQRFTAGASVEDGSWLGVSTLAGSAKASDPASLMVTANPGRLDPGTYRGAVAITSATGGDPVQVPVTMTVSDVRHKILVSQTGLSFTAVAGGGVSAPQTLGILDEGDGKMSWAARAVTLEGGNWLRLDSAAGRADRALLDVSPLEVSVIAQGLAPGEYYGRITVTAPADNSPQTVTVLLRVLPEGSDPGPEVRPASLIFVGYPGVNPGSQNVVVSNLLRRPVSFGSSRTTEDGSPWLVHSPPNATVAPEGAVRMVVQPDYSNLAPGAWTGLITLQFEGAVRKISVLGVVAPGAPGGRAAAGCSSPRLRVQLNSPSDDFTVMIGQPSTIEARVVDECGTPLVPDPSRAATEVAATFNAAGESNLRLTHVGGGTWTGTWRPLVSGPAVATVSAVLIQGNTRQIGVVQRSGTVQSGSRTPLVSPGSLVHAASFGAGFPVAPGGLITIYGANLSERVSVVREMPLPLQLDETEVVLGGQPLPILYSSDKQINAQVPFDLAVNTQHQVVVRRRNQISVPESFTVSAAQPGIFTKNQQGFGQGIIMKSDQRTLAEPATPAARGEAIVIYCAGLGAVSPPVGPGQPAPLPPATTVNPVTLTIGGQPAQVLFSGLTPGFAGLYQVNALTPQNVAPGDDVPVVLRVAGQTSPPATMAVR
ncbi:MAG: IPT/TIG domain-containing protein, partial [Bryobacterales bacterium]|nr:IPT/TIG domain-containing protein [Bryobacterales bacterium]